MQVILARRSIRRYTAQKVSDEAVMDLLRAAMSAPSAGNEQPWHFVVISERPLLDAIPAFAPDAPMLAEAPRAILVCADPRNLKYGEQFWVQDCSAATENILLAAQAIGLGAVWLGIYPSEPEVRGMRELLGLPPGIVPFSLIAVGYPAEHKPPADRFKPERVHRNRW